MKIRKGDFGYIKAQKKKRILVTASLFSIPLVIFITGLIRTGSRLNLFTFVAIMGCLPAARSAVGMVMMLLQKPTEESIYQQIREKGSNLVCAYELAISAYEKHTYIDCLVVCGYHVAGYSSREKTDVPFIEQHIKKVLTGNGYKSDVKIYKDFKHYLERVSGLNAKRESIEKDISFTPNETYPDLTRSELVKHTILAISL